LVQSWLQHAERFRASPVVRAAWAEEAQRHREAAEAEHHERRRKETQRLVFNVAQFRETYMAGAAEGAGGGEVPPLPDANAAPVPAAPRKKKLPPYPHKKLLPNSISTALINRFRCYPGDAVLQCQRALATAIADGTLASDLTCDQLCDHVDTHGGFAYFSSPSAPRHPYID
jgi:hypothetical protein